MKIGFIGLGKMGSRMVEKIVNEGDQVVAWNRSPQPADELKAKLKTGSGLEIAESIESLVHSLPKPRVVVLMLPAGLVTDRVLQQVEKLVEAGDIVVDDGNSYYKDSDRHFKKFARKNVRFLGIGISGGIVAMHDGYPMMVGGDESAYQYIKPVLDNLAKPGGGHEYFGPGGAGHFVKMVHNGIEYPIMQALGEGFGVMDSSPYNLDLSKVAALYQKGTLVSGFMLDRALEAIEDDTVNQVEGIIGSASGEAVWTVQEAKKYGLPAESIQRAIEFRERSETDKKIQASYAARMIGALRIKFGGHSVKTK